MSIIIDLFSDTYSVIADTQRVADILVEDRQNSKDKKFIDVVLETCIDEKSKKGDILVYLMGGFHNSAISRIFSFFSS